MPLALMLLQYSESELRLGRIICRAMHRTRVFVTDFFGIVKSAVLAP
jgi:hypothetical protein